MVWQNIGYISVSRSFPGDNFETPTRPSLLLDNREGGNRTCQFNANRCFELLAFASQNVQLPHGPGSDAFHL